MLACQRVKGVLCIVDVVAVVPHANDAPERACGEADLL